MEEPPPLNETRPMPRASSSSASSRLSSRPSSSSPPSSLGQHPLRWPSSPNTLMKRVVMLQNLKWRVHLPLKLHAQAKACQPRARDTFPAAETSTPTHEVLLQQPSAYSQRPSGPAADSSPTKKRGRESQVPVGVSDHTTNSGSASA